MQSIIYARRHYTPWVLFAEGCDFNREDTYIDSKLFMMNEFYPLNKIFVYKRDGNQIKEKNNFSPLSMFAREEKWQSKEMLEKCKLIVDTSLGYYIF